MVDTCAIEALICDFDGVLTDNFVYVDQSGTESVRCSRSDGMAIGALVSAGIPVLIVSTETNMIVTARAEKLKADVVQATIDKKRTLLDVAEHRSLDLNRTAFVGNDLNDVDAMMLCGVRACPADAHACVKAICTHQLRTPGGHGAIREFVEVAIGFDILAALRNQSTQYLG